MSSQYRPYIALLLICIIWGTTYFALRVGVAGIPPFLFSGVRQVLAGLILMGILKSAGKFKLRKSDILPQLIIGICMITLGNGIVGWSEQYIPSGVAALIVSGTPIYVIVIKFFIPHLRATVNSFIIAGLVLGFVGVLFIFKDNLKFFLDPHYSAGIFLCMLASFSWAVGSLYAKYKAGKPDVLSAAALQMLLGGIVLLLASPFVDNYATIGEINHESIWALIYLILIGSVLAYSCYVYALEHLPIELVSLYTYVNPFIAILLGYFFLDESLTWIMGLALGFTILGVFLINKGQKIIPKL